APGVGLAHPPDRLEDPALALFAHALDRAYAARHARGLEILERLDAEGGVERRDLVETQARDAGELERDRRDARALVLESLRASGLVELGDHRGQRRADARQRREPAAGDELAEVGVETLENLGAARVGARLEGLLTGCVEQPGHLAQGSNDRQAISSRCGTRLFLHLVQPRGSVRSV